jgi:hypothetical protein
MHSYSKEETIIHGIAIAINDLILDATEDAAMDFKSDIEPTEANVQIDNSETLVAPAVAQPPVKLLEDKILDAVIKILTARRSMGQDWQTLRDIFPHERFTL